MSKYVVHVGASACLVYKHVCVKVWIGQVHASTIKK